MIRFQTIYHSINFKGDVNILFGILNNFYVGSRMILFGIPHGIF